MSSAMEHTYLRYECADAFGLTISNTSSKAPPSNSSLAFLRRHKSLVVTAAGAQGLVIDLKTSQIVAKIGHRERISGGLGTGRALSSDEMVCLDSSAEKMAAGYVDGTVRLFEVTDGDLKQGNGLVNSLLEDENRDVPPEPLLLQGHGQSPVRSIRLDSFTHSRLASGASDGSVILWDIIAESGLYRLLGHRGAITDMHFLRTERVDGLITASLDGTVKIWDLKGQCCIQTLANHRGEVLCTTLMRNEAKDDGSVRHRLVSGSADGKIRVWELQDDTDASPDDTFKFIGKIDPPPSISSSEKVTSLHCHPSGKHLGVVRDNSKSVDLYALRSAKESEKRRQRRLKRRQEKHKKKNARDEGSRLAKARGILDDEAEGEGQNEHLPTDLELFSENMIKASDEFEFLTSIRASHKIKGFVFSPSKEKGDVLRITLALSSNALEYFVVRRREKEGNQVVYEANLLSDTSMLGHSTGVRSVAISTDDRHACSVSKSCIKIWDIPRRSVIQSVEPDLKSFGKKATCYCLCSAWISDSHLVVGTREGHLFLYSSARGEIIQHVEKAHDGAIWSIDTRRSGSVEQSISILTGSADKSVRFWTLEAHEDGSPSLKHTRTLQMNDDVVAARYSHTTDSAALMVFVATLDATVKVFYDDSLKLFLSLYGHKLPALAVDCSDDDALLVSGGADKTIKIFGLDFGDTHRTLHGHDDSITDLRFVKRTHNFFSASKDGTVRYWDADRFTQILLLDGHFAEVNSLAISRTGAHILSAGMDRQIRVWERTKDIVFLEEERERRLEAAFDRIDDRDEGDTAAILARKNDDEAMGEVEPESREAVMQSVLSISAGDRLAEALEKADEEAKEIARYRRVHGPDSIRPLNPLMLGHDPKSYVLWVLRSIKHAEIGQSLLILSLGHVERLLHYLVLLLRTNRATELSSKVAVAVIKLFQNQIIASRNMAPKLKELRHWIRLRLGRERDMIGFDIAAMRMVGRVAGERKQRGFAAQPTDIWAGLGLGSDVAASLEGRKRAKT